MSPMNYRPFIRCEKCKSVIIVGLWENPRNECQKCLDEGGE